VKKYEGKILKDRERRKEKGNNLKIFWKKDLKLKFRKIGFFLR